jgi:hypothetical protein
LPLPLEPPLIRIPPSVDRLGTAAHQFDELIVEGAADSGERQQAAADRVHIQRPAGFSVNRHGGDRSAAAT